MNLATQIEDTFGESKHSCIRYTEAQEFWVYDPPETNAPAEFLLTPIPKLNALKVENNNSRSIHFFCIDNCLLPPKVKKCDCMLNYRKGLSQIVHWIELKLNTTNTNINVIKKVVKGNSDVGGDEPGAIHQIIASRNYFREKGINLDRYSEQAFVAFPSEVEKAKGISQTLQQLQRQLQKSPKFGITLHIGSKLKIG